jgi:hypothetical protein
MKALNKGLKYYNDIYKNKDNATVVELAEAKVYFDSIGGEFKTKSKELNTRLEKFTKEDLFSIAGADEEEFVFDANTTYILKEIPKTIEDINEIEILKLKGMIDGKYFKTETRTVIDKQLILDELGGGTLDPNVARFVKVYEQTALGFRKKPVKKSKAKVSKS